MADRKRLVYVFRKFRVQAHIMSVYDGCTARGHLCATCPGALDPHYGTPAHSCGVDGGTSSSSCASASTASAAGEAAASAFLAAEASTSLSWCSVASVCTTPSTAVATSSSTATREGSVEALRPDAAFLDEKTLFAHNVRVGGYGGLVASWCGKINKGTVLQKHRLISVWLSAKVCLGNVKSPTFCLLMSR